MFGNFVLGMMMMSVISSIVAFPQNHFSCPGCSFSLAAPIKENNCLDGQVWDSVRRICTQGYQLPINNPSDTDYEYVYEYEYEERK